jgi:4-hydroxy-tetrahydrodipicolinate reductase
MSTGKGSNERVGVIIIGASGRMGSRLCALSHEDDGFELSGAIEVAGSGCAGREAAPGSGVRIAELPVNTAELRGDVVIDFSSDAGAREATRLAQSIGAALLIGTTALSEQTRTAVREAAKKIPALIAPNTSLGVAALARAVREMASMLGPGYRCSIVEAHHSAKKDAPSGTALRLAEAARAGGADLPGDQVLAIRGGDVIGEHTVRFAGAGEYIELTHRATSRDLFVRGALRTAAWLKGKPAGLCTMEDVLGIAAR